MAIPVFYKKIEGFEIEQSKHMVGMDGLISTCAAQSIASQQSLKKIGTAVCAATMCSKIACDNNKNNNNIFEETFDHCFMENNLIGSHI